MKEVTDPFHCLNGVAAGEVLCRVGERARQDAAVLDAVQHHGGNLYGPVDDPALVVGELGVLALSLPRVSVKVQSGGETFAQGALCRIKYLRVDRPSGRPALPQSLDEREVVGPDGSVGQGLLLKEEGVSADGSAGWVPKTCSRWSTQAGRRTSSRAILTDVKSTITETAAQVAESIRQILKFIPAQRLGLTTDCGLVMLQRMTTQPKVRALADGTEITRRTSVRES